MKWQMIQTASISEHLNTRVLCLTLSRIIKLLTFHFLWVANLRLHAHFARGDLYSVFLSSGVVLALV